MATERVTATYDAELIAAVRQLVGARQVSAFLNEAVREKLAKIRLLQLIDELDAKYGAPTPAEMAAVSAEAEELLR